MIERELSYLAKTLPPDLAKYPFKEIVDCYLPVEAAHPILRIRKAGTTQELTKKVPLGDDFSIQQEYTIPLSDTEYKTLLTLPAKMIHKHRYLYPYKGQTAEIDVFLGPLLGLVIVEFEFTDESAKAVFEQPSFCLVDVSQEERIAGGSLCGKRYDDLAPLLQQYGYCKLFL